MITKIKDCLKKIIYNLPIKHFLKNYILFESNPDYSDNSRSVFDRLIELGYNKKYKLIWFVDIDNRFNDVKIHNVKFIGKKHKNKRLYYNITAKYIIDCNKYIKKMNKNQIRIHLTHGETIKDVGKYFWLCGEVNYLIELSDFFTDYKSSFFNVEKEKIIPTGYPRNDILVRGNSKDIFFEDIGRKKTILWLPTFRQHKSHTRKGYDLPYGIGCVNTEEELINLNNYLKDRSILLVIKLHPAEDTSKIDKFDFSNIKLIDDSLFDKNHSTLYRYLANVDALITDFSSVYYDFLLTNKPIGLAISDIKEYIECVNIIYDSFEKYIVADFLYNYDELLNFFDNVSKGIDNSYNERMQKKEIYQKYFDDGATDRVIKLLEENGEKNEKRN